MPGDTLRLPAEGGFAWEMPSGYEEVWAQIWFRDAGLVHWTVTSKGEIVEQNGPPMILWFWRFDLAPLGRLDMAPPGGGGGWFVTA